MVLTPIMLLQVFSSTDALWYGRHDRRLSGNAKHFPHTNEIGGFETFGEAAVDRPDEITGSLDLAIRDPDLSELQRPLSIHMKVSIAAEPRPSISHNTLQRT